MTSFNWLQRLETVIFDGVDEQHSERQEVEKKHQISKTVFDMKFDSNFMLESCFVRGSLPKDCTAQHFAHLSNEVTRFLQQRATELKSRVLAATADRAEADPVAKVDEG